MSPTAQKPRIALIAAVAANGTIGRDGGMPWHLPEDLRHFKRQTMGRRIIMGRRTWESLPGLLPGREHIVIAHQPLALPAGAFWAGSVQEALALPLPQLGPGASGQGGAAPGQAEPERATVFVVGGAQIYAQTLALADDLYLTEIDADIEGDTRFPDWERSAFEEQSRQWREAPLQPGGVPVRYAFVHYRRRPAAQAATAL
ncbi:dihydrofolate reductase [Vandammella animalimorsus]|uniref:dihydrofolate reductase n=1 Tax=Vandammella animalimorsus TaxID=2029117 RepID=A0A2A2ADH6_9BURK|nr:dihydrofolate reductase [Vandammella animalimorsus]PAT35774.1 diacylglycerol kinase [Vandammella animalimorsus]